VTSSLLASLGIYGASLVIAFVAGLFPVLSVEVFLIGLSALRHPSLGDLAVCCVLAAVGHQIAKTITYFAGEGALKLPRGRTKVYLEKAQKYIDRWNKRPLLVMCLSATIGIPPLVVLGLVAGPMMHVKFVPFTIICFVGRFGRFMVMTFVALQF
jgi:membrane protein YqaA with SNARE-associated domain